MLVQQLRRDPFLDELREVVGVVLVPSLLRDFAAEHFLADRVHQQARGDLTVGRVFFHQGARRQNGRLVQFLDRHAVVQVLDRFGKDGFGVDMLFQADAGGQNQRAHLIQIQRTALTAFRDVNLRRQRRPLLALRCCARSSMRLARYST